MIQLKIYDKDMGELTAFNEGEFGRLQYKKTLGEVGDASFTIDINNSKVTTLNLQNYNRMEISVDGVVEWVGYIIKKDISFTVVQIRCLELIGILKKRLVPSAYTLSGNVSTAVDTLLAQINGDDDTGITLGATDLTDSVNMTFERQDALAVLKSLADSVGAQFRLNSDRTIDFLSSVGQDLSASVLFTYRTTQPSQANILKFDVSDDGDSIVSRSIGKSDALSSTQDDAPLQTKYGVIEQFNNFRVANTQGNLDDLTADKNMDSLFSPSLDLAPTVEDNFEIGDIVSIKIKNKLVDIDNTFQVLEKSVKIVNNQKSISVKINEIPKTIVNTIGDLKSKVELLENNL